MTNAILRLNHKIMVQPLTMAKIVTSPKTMDQALTALKETTATQRKDWITSKKKKTV